MHHRIIPLLIVVGLILGTPAAAGAGSGDDLRTALDEQMPALLARYGVPGTVVARISNGEVAWTQAYGLADVAAGEPMDAAMVLEFGSLGKVITAWAVMRLVDQGRLDLDAPANDYLKRWQVESSRYDSNRVTIRRLLSHTSGLSIHGYVDYSPRRAALPGLVESVDGKHLMEGLLETLQTGRPSLGNVELVQEPGSGYKYSGGGYAVLQMVIEDVTGEPFDAFMQREITDPLGATSMRWAWTPELRARAPVPYGDEGQPLEHRQLAIHGIGSEIGTVTDLARFVAAAVPGPNGEPAGRGVLEPETVKLMASPQVGTGGVHGLGYGAGRINGNGTVSHSGANSGWMAFFILDTVRREGFVIASPSNRADPLHRTVTNLWLDNVYGPGQRTDWAPAPALGTFSLVSLALALILALALLVTLLRFARQVRLGRRRRAGRPRLRSLVLGLPWLLWLLFAVYTTYTSLPLYLPAGFPDLWATPGSHVLLAVLAAWVLYSGVAAFFRPRTAGSLSTT